jgi:pre-rRNA-processing protein TSR3
MFYQDDPSKCTAAKLVKFGLAKQFKKNFANNTRNMILDPFANDFVLNSDKELTDSITGIDCSWERAQEMFVKKFAGLARKLPPLLAGNPVNYSKIGKLTTAEAIAGALYIMGFDDLAASILNKFKWGHTFYELNQDLIKDYSQAKSNQDIIRISNEYQLNVI